MHTKFNHHINKYIWLKFFFYFFQFKFMVFLQICASVDDRVVFLIKFRQSF